MVDGGVLAHLDKQLECCSPLPGSFAGCNGWVVSNDLHGERVATPGGDKSDGNPLKSQWSDTRQNTGTENYSHLGNDQQCCNNALSIQHQGHCQDILHLASLEGSSMFPTWNWKSRFFIKACALFLGVFQHRNTVMDFKNIKNACRPQKDFFVVVVIASFGAPQSHTKFAGR